MPKAIRLSIDGRVKSHAREAATPLLHSRTDYLPSGGYLGASLEQELDGYLKGRVDRKFKAVGYCREIAKSVSS